MVKRTGKNFQCESCGLKYAGKAIAEKCQAWCTKNNSCNLEITKSALKDYSKWLE